MFIFVKCIEVSPDSVPTLYFEHILLTHFVVVHCYCLCFILSHLSYFEVLFILYNNTYYKAAVKSQLHDIAVQKSTEILRRDIANDVKVGVIFFSICHTHTRVCSVYPSSYVFCD